MRHGSSPDPAPSPDDPELANVNADMSAWRLLDQLSPCECGHPQQDHDEDDRCGRCGCGLFRDA